ncbi:glycerophosphodiester phosphodiesterase [Acinetobacter shaoyimingii]|uniref:glycerophosphodiester phosphodiesterase n=1 Tax=Acinetobacter shaoyimingii TaxID=2715164 RepID=A0A6G8RXG6_9GAMM|nr:glycerophosphodiester phosphodiesterase [Acinetobacter shaoyimingii]QIO06561.1 glycerophosphodiester phosphodiesterase [Acinetobacter shaoyimingii]
MYKKIIFSLGLVSVLSACHSDDSKNNAQHVPTPPDNTYVEPKIIIVGHRGASALRPEHTLASYEKAIADGADFIEPDLVSTKDGVLIARHENEIGGTTNVSTLANFSNRKATKTIDGQNYTGWFSEDFTYNELQQNVKARERIPELRPDNTQYNDQYSIPTLDQIIELADQHYQKTGKIIGLYIETKHPTYFKKLGLSMEDQLLHTLAKYKYTREIAPIYLQSFEVSNLKYLKQKLAQNPSLKHTKLIQLLDSPIMRPADLVESGNKQTYLDLALPTGLKQIATYADGVGPSKTYIFSNTDQNSTTSFIQDAHAVGLKVHPYTLRPENNFLPSYLRCSQSLAERCIKGAEQEYTRFFKAGVDGLFTDDPQLGREALIKFQKTP